MGGFLEGLGNFASSVLSPLASVGGVIGSFIGGHQANKMDEKNLKFQKEQYAYQKQLQQQMFAREDNAVARRVADLKASGINPVLAAGQAAAAGQEVNTTAPQYDTSGISQRKAMERAQRMDLIGAILQNISMSEQISHTRTQTEALRQQMGFVPLEFGLKSRDVFTREGQLDVYRKQQQLNRDIHIFEKEKWKTEKILKQAQTNKLNLESALHELEAMGLSHDISRKVLDNIAAGYNIRESIRRGIRTTEGSSTGERIGAGLTGRYAIEAQNAVDREMAKIGANITNPRNQIPTTRPGKGRDVPPRRSR